MGSSGLTFRDAIDTNGYRDSLTVSIAGAAVLQDQYTYDLDGRMTSVTQTGFACSYTAATFIYLCPCQLADVDFFRAALLFRPGTEKRVGGAGGGASSPCSPARGGRNRGTQQRSNGCVWQDAPRTSPTLCA
jgi:hypothetical protein